VPAVGDHAVCAAAEGTSGERKRHKFDIGDRAAVEMNEGMIVCTDGKMCRIAE
jgi:hypothetical protein